MDCQQVWSAIEELFNDEKSPQQITGLKEHLDQCRGCRDRYALERRVVGALEELETYPVPPDFTARVLNQLPAAVPQPPSSRTVHIEAVLRWLREAWNSLVTGLARPAPRRRLVPILAGAASLLLILGLLYGLHGNDIPTTPGAAIGTPLWVVAGGVVAVLAIALLIWWRKK